MNVIKMLYSIEPRDRRYVRGYGFLSFARNIGKNIGNMYNQKLVTVLKSLQQMQEKLLQKEQS